MGKYKSSNIQSNNTKINTTKRSSSTNRIIILLHIYKATIKTKTKIYSVEVDDDQYKRLQSVIEDINLNKGSYHFNILGLFAVAFNLKVKREKYFYCAEFVKYVLDESNIELNLPDIIKPNDFEGLTGLEEIYKGRLNEYLL